MKKFKKMKKIAAIACMAAMVVTLCAGCKKEDSGSKAEDTSLSDVKDKGELVLGLDDSFPPMGFRDKDNNIVGFDIDVAAEVCERMGVKLVLQPISWKSNVMELNSGNVDCLWNGMSINDTRKKQMNLSESYMNNDMVFVVREDSDIKTLDDLKGKKVNVQNGSTAQEILEDSDIYKDLKEVVGLDDNVTAFLDLEAEGVEAVFVDSVVANYYIAENDKPFVVLDESLETEEYAIGFRKEDSALRDEVQKILSEMKKDGTLADISEKWFGKDVTTVK